jgi:hypothetical protein
LPAFADILLELHPFVTGAPADRRRLLFGFSRHEETPPGLLIELNPEGAAYRILPEERCADFPDYWPVLEFVLAEAPAPLTRAQIRDRWGDDPPRPPMRTLWSWLNTTCAENLVARSGTGRANDPFKYWLPGRMPVWLADPFWCHIHGIKPPLDGDATETASIPPKAVAAPLAEPTPAESPVAIAEETPAPAPAADPPATPPRDDNSFRRWAESLLRKG